MLPLPSSFCITTSLRYDSQLQGIGQNTLLSADSIKGTPIYMFKHHRDRLIASAEAFSWPSVISLLSGSEGYNILYKAIINHLDTNPPEKPLKIRIAVSESGEIEVTSTPVPEISNLSILFPEALTISPTFGQEWKIAISPIPTPISLLTKHKTTSRDHYDAVRLAGAGPGVEILLRNEHGEVSEGTVTTPYFWRDGVWITPRESCGGNLGTTRRWALDNGLAQEGVVMVDEIEHDEVIWVSNGVRGWGWGRVDRGKKVE